MAINLANYPDLAGYAVLGGSQVSSANQSNINDGNVGSYPTTSVTGTYNFNLGYGIDNGTNAQNAQLNLESLVGAINAFPFTSTVTLSSPVTGIKAILPSTKYTSGSSLTFGISELTFSGTSPASASTDQFFIIVPAAITFNDTTFILGSGVLASNIFIVAGSAITFSASPSTIPGIIIGNSAVTFSQTSVITGNVYGRSLGAGSVGAVSFDGTTAGISATVNSATSSFVCYLKGSLILTDSGYVPIENLKEGDMVETRGEIYDDEFIDEDSETCLEPILWISKFKVNYLSSKSRPICIKKDAFGENLPFSDLYVSPEHRLLLNDKMVPAKTILNGQDIYQDNECEDVVYYHLELDTHMAIVANGILAESYVDVGNRHVFEKKSDPKKETM